MNVVHHLRERRRILSHEALQLVARQARMVGHQLTRGDLARAGKTRLDRESRNVVTQGLVDIEPSLLYQLHRRCVGEQFGDGSHTVDGIGRRRNVLFLVGISKAICPDDALVIHQGDAQPFHRSFVHFIPGQFGDIGLDRGIVAPGNAGRTRRCHRATGKNDDGKYDGKQSHDLRPLV